MLCECGCGEDTGRYASRAKHLKGKSPRFIKDHHTRVTRQDPWEVKDCGYETPCWVWQMQIIASGYGVRWVWLDGVKRGRVAHRLVYEQHRGPVPEGLELDHLCRNRACVNPEHLEAVPRAINLRRGIRTKLDEEKVAEIRLRSSRGVSYEALADEFGVHPSTVRHAATFRTWKPVPAY